jgi:hypothetical protein
VDEYREGQVKSTPVRGVKEILKPHTYKRSEVGMGNHVRLTACLLHYDPASYSSDARLRCSAPEPQRKRVLSRGRMSIWGYDPKPGRSTHEQGEAEVTLSGGPNPYGLKTVGMTCG